jgi:hypothetical protein
VEDRCKQNRRKRKKFKETKDHKSPKRTQNKKKKLYTCDDTHRIFHNFRSMFYRSFGAKNV